MTKSRARAATHHVGFVEEHGLAELGLVVVLLGVQEPHEDDGADAENERRQQADAAQCIPLKSARCWQ